MKNLAVNKFLNERNNAIKQKNHQKSKYKYLEKFG
jgi:hypothetical protein